MEKGVNDGGLSLERVKPPDVMKPLFFTSEQISNYSWTFRAFCTQPENLNANFAYGNLSFHQIVPSDLINVCSRGSVRAARRLD